MQSASMLNVTCKISSSPMSLVLQLHWVADCRGAGVDNKQYTIYIYNIYIYIDDHDKKIHIYIYVYIIIIYYIYILRNKYAN